MKLNISSFADMMNADDALLDSWTRFKECPSSLVPIL